MFKIEKNIPIPKADRGPGPGRNEKYPWSEMVPGDSFFVPETKVSRIYGAAWKASKRHNVKFVVRKVGDGVRVWREK
jgi:hypothetical protein